MHIVTSIRRAVALIEAFNRPLTWIWRLAQREQLPQDDAERPHVRLRRENAVRYRLDSHPFDGQRTLSLLLIISRTIHFFGQSKVGNLDDVIISQQDVACSQVSVQHLGN